MILDAVKAGVLLFVAVLVQVSVLSSYTLVGGGADLVLVTLLCIALLRGSSFGAAAGFYAGFLLDVAYLDTLGLTSLLLTLAGFWIGRYGETTARDRIPAPYVSVGVVTILYVLGAIVLRFVLGDAVPAREVLAGLPGAVVLNLVLTLPVYALARRLFPPAAATGRVHEVRLLG